MALFFALLKANRADSGPLKPVLISIMTLTSYELAQLAIPGRTFDGFDFVATAMGGAVAFVLLQLVYRSHPSLSEGQ